MGRSAFFIRLFGCPVQCPWCDSAGTWHSDYAPKEIERLTVEPLVERAVKSGAEFVVLTGGEPAIHDLSRLTRALRDSGMPSHLETCGGFEIKGTFDWITLSPKWQKLPLPENLERASEFKLIIEDEASIVKWIQEIGSCFDDRPVWLNPEWSRRADQRILNSICSCVKQRGAPFRAGYQLHKLYHVDQLDENVRRPVPLGGDESLGY